MDPMSVSVRTIATLAAVLHCIEVGSTMEQLLERKELTRVRVLLKIFLVFCRRVVIQDVLANSQVVQFVLVYQASWLAAL